MWILALKELTAPYKGSLPPTPRPSPPGDTDCFFLLKVRI